MEARQDGQSVYVAGMRDVLVSLDAGTGSERWRVDFVEQCKSPLPAFGFEKSDLLDSRTISEQETWGHLAVCGEQVFVRELNGVSAYHWK